jgi:hypothetical protein
MLKIHEMAHTRQLKKKNYQRDRQLFASLLLSARLHSFYDGLQKLVRRKMACINKCVNLCFSLKIEEHILRHNDRDRIANVFLRGTFPQLASSGTTAEE